MERAVVGGHVAPWLKKLVQGIILQAIEDLYCDELRCDCMALFEGEDFEICAETAGMDVASQAVLLNLVKHIIAANDPRTETGTWGHLGSALTIDFCPSGRLAATVVSAHTSQR